MGRPPALCQEAGWRLAASRWHPCGDFRGLIELEIVADSYVVPNLHGLNYNLKGKQVFSQLDLVKGYFQVPVHKDNQAKTTVVTPFGTFQFYAIQS